MNFHRCFVCGFFLAINFMMMSNELYALESSANYAVGVAFTDNSLLTEKNKKNEISTKASFGFNLLETLSDLNYSLNTNVRYTKYNNKTLSDTTYYNLIGNLNWDIIPTSLSWKINNNLSVQEINQSNRPLPVNNQQVNIFSTGPSSIYRLSSTNRMLLDYRYSDVSYQKKNQVQRLDNTRDLYTLTLDHDISQRSNVALVFDETKVKYLDKNIRNDFTGNSVYLSYNSLNARSTLNVSFGMKKARIISTKKEFDSDFRSLQWIYQINYSADFNASYWKGLSDASNDIGLSTFLNSTVINTANINNASIFTVERLNLLYNINKTNWRLSFGLYGVEQDYDQVIPNLKTFGGNVNFDYNLSSSLILTSAVTQRLRKTLANPEQKTFDKTFSVGTRYYISNKLQFITQYRNNTRTSNFGARTYEQNILLFSLVYISAPLAAR